MQLPDHNQIYSYSQLTNNPITLPKRRPEAYCTSYRCEGLTRDNTRYNRKLGALKHVPLQTIDCPECGEALYWFSGQKLLSEDWKK